MIGKDHTNVQKRERERKREGVRERKWGEIERYYNLPIALAASMPTVLADRVRMCISFSARILSATSVNK